MTAADPGTQPFLRAHNDRMALRLLLEHGPLSRSRLGMMSGVSKPTAGQMIVRLERAGLVEPAGSVAEARGPNAVVYGVRRDAMTGVAISILADRIEAVLADPLDSEHPVVAVPVDGAERGPEADVHRAIDAVCRSAGIARAAVSVIAVGVQAAVDAQADALTLTDTLPGWPERGARAALAAATGMTVLLENDVNLATIAERSAGVAQDSSSFAYFWIGEGLGVGLDIGGALHRGAAGGAGEIGYLEVPRSAARIDPLAHDYTDLLGGAAMLDLLGLPDGTVLADAVGVLAHDDRLLDAVADRAALAVDAIATLFDPELVVLGGATGRAGGAALAERVQQRLDARHAEPRRAEPLRVAASAAGAQPVLLGARRLLVAGIRDRLEASIAAD